MVRPVRRILKWVLWGLVLAAGLYISWKLGRLGYKLIFPDPVPVTVYRLTRGTVEETVTNSKAGTVKARRRAKMSPEVGGRVAYIGFRPGARVRQGDVLMRINDRDLKAALDLARQDLESARASAQEACVAADLAGRELKRLQDLARDSNSIVSQEMLDRAQSDSHSTAARCQGARATIQR